MKVYVVVEHVDSYERGHNALITTDKKKAEALEGELSKKGYQPVIEEHEVVE